MLPSEILIEAKGLFGKYGQRWTRGVLNRPGVFGRNYCSIGAIQAVGGSGNCAARDYLRKVIEEETGKIMAVEDFNDTGTSSPRLRHMPLWLSISILLLSLLPGIRLIRWFKIRRVWCRAIKLALDDEMKETEGEQVC